MKLTKKFKIILNWLCLSFTAIKIDKWTNRLAVVSAIISLLTLLAIYGQLKEMKAEQRPWVYAVDVKPAGRIVLVDGKYAIPLKFFIKNTGHLPAFFVQPKTAATVIAAEGRSTKDIRNEVCDKYRNAALTEGNGITVFADQTVTRGGFTSDDYPTIRKDAWDNLGGDKVLLVFGCVDYQFPDQPGHHQSRFSFAVGKLVDDGILERIGWLPDDPTTVDIRLNPIAINDGQPAD
jgi:hypothetical protein